MCVRRPSLAVCSARRLGDLLSCAAYVRQMHKCAAMASETRVMVRVLSRSPRRPADFALRAAARPARRTSGAALHSRAAAPYQGVRFRVYSRRTGGQWVLRGAQLCRHGLQPVPQRIVVVLHRPKQGVDLGQTAGRAGSQRVLRGAQLRSHGVQAVPQRVVVMLQRRAAVQAQRQLLVAQLLVVLQLGDVALLALLGARGALRTRGPSHQR